MQISAFKAALTGGGARPNQFRVRLMFPAVISGGTNAMRAGEFLCEGTQLPGSIIGTAQAMYRGRRVPLYGDRQFQPWTFTVINDADFTIRNAFEAWMHYANNVRDNTGVTNPLLYSVDMGVDHLDRNDNVIKTYEFRSAFPVYVDPINLQFGDNDNLERFNVTIEYVNWDTPDLS
jgi:hypothetical protein